jgi:non-specific protein-tyrosine kinase
LNGTRGLTSVLAGEAQLRDVIIPVTAVPKLYVVPAGPAVAEPSELLASSRMADVVRALRAEDTIVLLDSPPVLPVADALVTAPLADATLVVCRSGRSSAKDLSRALGLLRQVNASLSGIILNAVPATEAYGGTYTYGRATEESEDQPRSVPAGTQPVQAKGDRS